MPLQPEKKEVEAWVLSCRCGTKGPHATTSRNESDCIPSSGVRLYLTPPVIRSSPSPWEGPQLRELTISSVKRTPFRE